MTILSPDEWIPRWLHHDEQSRARTADHIARRKRGEKNPLEDFLWNYYPLRPGRFHTWYPGIDDDGAVALQRPASSLSDARAYWSKIVQSRWFCHSDDETYCYLDLEAFTQHRAHGISFLRTLLRKVQDTQPVFGCLGWHEWAMAYKIDTLRHPLPLRLGTETTNTLVEQAHIRCTHFDAYQFFSPAAVELNTVKPTYDSVLEFEQPGCIHVSMDLLRACIQLGPLIPGELLIESYDLALRARTIDMAASPYDCSTLGLAPIQIETAAGKAQYIQAQQELTELARPLRAKILAILDRASLSC
ncbi:hypothetical protein JOD55_001028 [Arcanobacterium pluranimalium]|uniref:3-methyladenine DNA glycosylase n=1 Tax=Arcanobacterium pluranimalium TaxID=108028 RepID=UPI001958BBC9|nr:3-methyladenine DNA glycosylase [Arcanobacterium pluranimalium]MBM7825201.1 hypothetical protein [Arcanobacterium pluranimalium]